MKLIYNPVFLKHDTGMHPENIKRLSSLGELPVTKLENGERYLELVHSPEYIKKIKDLVLMVVGIPMKIQSYRKEVMKRQSMQLVQRSWLQIAEILL